MIEINANHEQFSEKFYVLKIKRKFSKIRKKLKNTVIYIYE